MFGILILVICLTKIIEGWHDLTNVEFHCWPFGADDDKPTSFAVCVGIDLDWQTPPPKEVTESEAFTASFSLLLKPEFYSWAVQDAQDNFKANFFKYANETFITNNASAAQMWCEMSVCPAKCSEATQDNCCFHHVNVHSCPVEEVKFGLCPPWMPSDGGFYTHSPVNCGNAMQLNWTAEFSGLHLKNGKVTPTALIAHFKIATMHIALNWLINVLPRAVCGDEKCDEMYGEDCSTCPSDCDRCPLSNGAIAAIIVSASTILLLILSALMYIRYANNKLLWDESWIINYSDITPPTELTDLNVSCLNIMSSLKETTIKAFSGSSGQTGPVNPELGIYNGELHVLKRIPKKALKLTKQIRIEVRQIRKLDHGNLATFVGACVRVPNVVILSKYCSKGNLGNVMRAKNVPINWAFRFSFANDIISGLSYLHTREVEHGRLDIGNCLVDDRWAIKICDFGVPSLRSPVSNSTESLTNQPYAVWRAPELGKPCAESDIFSYGIIVIQIATRCFLPMEETDNLATVRMDWKNMLTRNELGSSDDRCPCPSAIALMVESCLTEQPSARPTAAALKKQLRLLNPSKMNAVDSMMTMMEKYSKHLEMMVADKTHDLIAEKQRTDELLHAMLPKQVADDLRMGRPVNADSFDNCTVYFSDIVGFTTISGKLSAMEVVVLLNKLYSCFDRVIDKHDVYKVETIGDAYVVVSGVPIRNGNKHVTNIANMAIDLLNESKMFKIPNMPNEPLKIRIGLHSGPVCAGVVGLKMPRYCLFGDTVNTASRMESNGEAYKIHMSNDSKEWLVRESPEGYYKVTERGTISVKGKGDLKTWWLEGKADTTDSEDVSIHLPGNVSRMP